MRRTLIVGMMMSGFVVSSCNALTGVNDLEVEPAGTAGNVGNVDGSSGTGGSQGSDASPDDDEDTGVDGGTHPIDASTDKPVEGDARDGQTPDVNVSDGDAAKPDVSDGDAGHSDATLDASDGADVVGDSAADAISCKPNEKPCGATCVATTEPATGCELASCTPCDLANATASCSQGKCAVAECQLGYADCNKAADDGCEAKLSSDGLNCGACGTKCAFANGEASCVGSTCVNGACNPGYQNCNGDTADGCEKHTDSDTTNCGVCGRACASVRATPTCSSGTCGTGTCDSGYMDCNGKAEDGCEVSILNDPANCSGCGKKCPEEPGRSATCTNGVCGLSNCASPLGDCDADGACETNLSDNTSNCGACGALCKLTNAEAACSTSQCVVSSCASNYGNCDSVQQNGCEAYLPADLDNCGACNNKCTSLGWSQVTSYGCLGGGCRIAACGAGYADCNGTTTDGCEVPTNSSVGNCGACGNACSTNNVTNVVCTDGKCGGTCAAGFGDCNSELRTDGCEAKLDDGNPCTEDTCGHEPKPEGTACGTGFCTASGTCGECRAGTTRCSSKTYQTCSVLGKWTDSAVCNIGCDTSVSGGCLTVTSLAAGGEHSCVTLSNGSAKCWGSGESGQLGIGKMGAGVIALRPLDVEKLSYAKTITASMAHTCVQRGDGGREIACWGANALGQLGDGTTTPTSLPPPEGIFKDVVFLAGGDFHSNCVIRDGGTVWCWGFALTGQGFGGKDSWPSPKQIGIGVSRTAQALRLAVGSYHACAIVSDVLMTTHGAKCWGDNGAGQIGDKNAPTDPIGSVFVVGQVTGLNWTLLGAGDFSSYGFGNTGRVENSYTYAWGANGSGQLGDKSTVDKPLATDTSPILLNGALGIKSVDGGMRHACALVTIDPKPIRVARCFGLNEHGQLGSGTFGGTVLSYVEVKDPRGFSMNFDELAVGWTHTCGVLPNRQTVRCWGANAKGQLGNESTKDSAIPQDVVF